MRELDRPETIQDIVQGMAVRGNAPCVVTVHGSAASTCSYARIGQLALRLGHGLIAAGLQRGDPVAVVAPNSPELVVVRLGLAAAGALAVPIDDLATADEIRILIRDCGARRVFTTAGHLQAVRAACAGIETDIRLVGPGGGAPAWRTLLAAADTVALPVLARDDPTALLYTSGTTGTPKGFTLSHANILHNVEVLAAEHLIREGDRVLMPLPLHHAYPFVVGMLLPLRCGAQIVLPEAARGPELIKALALGRATAMIGVPGLYRALVQAIERRIEQRGALARGAFHALLGLSIWIRRGTGRRLGRWLFASLHHQLAPDLTLMASGGAHLEDEVAWALEGLGWSCYSGYGLAETASIFTGNLPNRQVVGSDGRPLPGGELRIADPDETGVGEIQLKGPSVFSGYRNNETANREAFTADGWFRTGDLGKLDAGGYLYVTGRIKEMIVLAGGKNVFPEEVEANLQRNPCLREVAVLEYKGRLVALVLPDFQAIAGSSSRRVEDVVRVTLSELGRRLPSFQRPAGFAIIREPLPRTRLGKLRRHLLPSIYERARAGRENQARPALLPEDAELLSRPPAGDVWRWLEQRYPDRPLAPDDSLDLDLGIDSLEWINLSLDLQERFGVRLTESEIAGILTVRDLLNGAVRAGTALPSVAPAPLSREQLRYIDPLRPWEVLIAALAYVLNRLACRALFRVAARGLENLPDRGPYILVANHLSDLDPLVLAACQPFRKLRHTRWGGEVSRLFRGRVRSALAHAVNVFPVDERAPQTSLAMALAVLERGESLVWFPESWRSPDGQIQRFLPGIGFLVAHSGAPCVPVRIKGTFEAMPRASRLPRPHKVRIAFGRTITSQQLGADSRAAGREQAIADALRDAVAGLDP